MIKKALKRKKINLPKQEIKELDDYILEGIGHLPENIENFVYNNIKTVIQKKCCNSEEVKDIVKKIVKHISLRDYDFTAEFIKDPVGTIQKIENENKN
ncbi:MAG: hypothetical protein ACTSRZ_00730 [Promethearchaeota archaeon]